MRGNGLYKLGEIQYCLDLNLIKHENIKYVIKSSLELENDYYNEFINYCVNELDNYDELIEIYKENHDEEDMTDLRKLGPNSMIGAFKPNLEKSKKWKSVCITRNSTEAYEYFLKDNACFIKTIRTDTDIYFHVFKEVSKSTCETEEQIYNQIIGLEAIELHKLGEIIKSKGGKILDLKTDCMCQTLSLKTLDIRSVRCRNLTRIQLSLASSQIHLSANS